MCIMNLFRSIKFSIARYLYTIELKYICAKRINQQQTRCAAFPYILKLRVSKTT